MYLNPNLTDYSPINEAHCRAESEEAYNDLLEDIRYEIEHDRIDDDVYIETARELACKNVKFSMFLDNLAFEVEKAAINYLATYGNCEVDIEKLVKENFTTPPFDDNDVLFELSEKINDL